MFLYCSDLSKGTFQSEKVREISIFVPSTNRSNISLHTALLFEFSRTKSQLPCCINEKNLNGLAIRELKDCFELIFGNLEWLLTLFTLFLLHEKVEDFEFEIEEQKKVHLFVDMTNISSPSEKNVPLLWEKIVVEIEKRKFAKLLRSLEQFIRTEKGKNNFWNSGLFKLVPWGFSDLIDWSNLNSNWI